MGFRRKNRILAAGKSPSVMAMKRTYARAILNGGTTVDFSQNVENIREISRKLGYNILSDATYCYVPSSYGESKNFAQVQNKRNLLQWSEDFSNAVHSLNAITLVLNSNLNPFGLNKSYYLQETGANTLHYTYNFENIPVIINNIYTSSFYVKKAQDSWIQIGNSGTNFGSGGWASFNFDTGLYGNKGSNANVTAKQINNGYWLLSISSTCTVSGNSNACILLGSNNTNANTGGTSYAGTLGHQICDVAAVQFELGAYATPYQKTVAAGDGIVDFNFTRATSATVTNKLGVIEESCYNLLQRSEEFDNALWIKNNTTISANSVVSPNGTLTSDSLFETTFNGVHQIATPTISVINGAQYTFSIYIKPNGRNNVALGADSLVYGNMSTFFDLSNGTIISSLANAASITPALNGFYRISITVTANATTSLNSEFILVTVQTGSTVSYIGDDTKGYYIWGAQLVQGSTPRPYLRTTNRLNVPKLDYSRGIGEPELLIERQSTNLLLQSETFTNASWVQQNTTTVLNATLNPFGVNKSYYITETATTGIHGPFQVVNVLASDYIASFYVKKADDSWVQISADGSGLGGAAWVNFNFDTGLFGNSGVIGSWAAKQLTNGYWLLTFKGTYSSPMTGRVPMIIVGTNNTNSATQNLSYLGITGHRIVDIAAIQLEQGSNATTYIPTTTATVTRNADASYTDLFNNAALSKSNFTLYWEGYLYDNSGANISFALSDTNTASSNTNQIGWIGAIQPFYNIGNTRTNTPSTSVANNSYNKLAIQYNNGTVNFYRNGVNIWASQTVAVFDYRYLVLSSGGSTFTTDKISLFNRTLTSTECTTLTT